MLPFTNVFTHKQLSLDITEPAIWLSLLGVFIFTTILSGAYPAIVICDHDQQFDEGETARFPRSSHCCPSFAIPEALLPDPTPIFADRALSVQPFSRKMLCCGTGAKRFSGQKAPRP
jgi:hypothetical protein